MKDLNPIQIFKAVPKKHVFKKGFFWGDTPRDIELAPDIRILPVGPISDGESHGEVFKICSSRKIKIYKRNGFITVIFRDKKVNNA